MTSLITCPGCLNKLTLPASFIGQRVKCPKCDVDFEAQPEAKLALDIGPQTMPTEPAKASSTPPPLPDPPLLGAYAPTTGPPARSAPSAAAPSMYCIECGTKFARSEDACPGCGLLLHEMLDERPRERRRPRARMLPHLNGMLPIASAILIPVGFVIAIAPPIIHDIFRFRWGRASDLFITMGVGASGLVELAALVCAMIWLYQAWRLVARGDEDYSPGLTVGLLFVPFFNFFWMFRALPGLSTAIQEELHYLAPTRAHNTGWVTGLLACILMLIPYFQPVAMCIFIAWMLIANNALQRIIRYHDRLREEEANDRGA